MFKSVILPIERDDSYISNQETEEQRKEKEYESNCWSK